jgi:hypothetical protein
LSQIAGLPGGVKQIQRTEIEAVVREMLGSQSKQKLTWNKAYVRDGQGNEIGQKGKFNEFLPYFRIPGFNKTYSQWYYIQNGLIMKANGEPIELSNVADNDPAAYKLVSDAYETYMHEAEQLDPMLCRHCRKYSAGSVDEAQRHLIIEHPDKVQEILGVAPKATSPASTPEFACDLCEKSFAKAKALRMHRISGHKAVVRTVA